MKAPGCTEATLGLAAAAGLQLGEGGADCAVLPLPEDLAHSACTLPLGQCFPSLGPRQPKPDPVASSRALQTQHGEPQARQCSEKVTDFWPPTAGCPRPTLRGSSGSLQAPGERASRADSPSLTLWFLGDFSFGTGPLARPVWVCRLRAGGGLPLSTCVCELVHFVFQGFGSLCSEGIFCRRI